MQGLACNAIGTTYQAYLSALLLHWPSDFANKKAPNAAATRPHAAPPQFQGETAKGTEPLKPAKRKRHIPHISSIVQTPR